MTTTSVTKYSIYCNTESTTVTGWGTAPPTQCYNNNAHSVNTATVATVETVYNANKGSTAIIYKYKIYCIDEEKYVEGWSSSSPTTCFHNLSHSVNLASVQELEVVNNAEVKIKEDAVVLNRNFKIISIVFNNVPSYQSQTVSYTFDLINSFYSFMFISDDTNKGDYLTIAASPNTALGLITQNMTAGATTLYAPIGLLLYGAVGFHIKATDGTNTDDLGYITAIDKVGGTVTFNIPAVHNFSSTNTLILMTYYICKDLEIGAPGIFRAADDINGGTLITPGTNVQFTYTNNARTIDLTEEPKNLVFYMEVLF